MPKVTTTAICTITDGEVLLNKDQARRRAHRLGPGKRKGWQAILEPIQFKAGETFEIDAVPKHLDGVLVDAMKLAAVAEEQAEENGSQPARDAV